MHLPAPLLRQANAVRAAADSSLRTLQEVAPQHREKAAEGEIVLASGGLYCASET
jgi:hypothetical protein